MKTFLKIALGILVLTSFSFRASADYPGAHPTYLHALTDLRTARYLISLPTPGPLDHFATDAIDHAIGEIKAAAIDDGKNLNDHPPIDATLDNAGRFHKALELLDKVHKDISTEEDNVYAQGLQGRALHHVTEAHDLVKAIIDSW
jgi:hypothetical protein